ncbi:MAG: DegT/DnrJ/EryC1/StrS family aminotransferase [Alphaproteobacteria bacterium]|nr:DegT/DnrJ/EryC1/StrS family aminotransferase [Alphaproteobacteria bacterium]
MIFSSYPKKYYLKHKKNILNNIKKTLDSGNYINSENVKKFEDEFANYLGVKYVIGVGNATDALYIILKSMGVGINHEVILPSHTAIATAISVSNTGAKPIFIDIGDDYNIDSNLISSKINKKTKAIICVHIYGQPCDLNRLKEISKMHKIPLIEDCSQSTGSEYNNKKTGSFGLASCHSFFPTKNLATFGDGGAISTNSKSLFSKMIKYREYGWGKNRNAEVVGINSRLDEIHASILRYNLKNIDINIKHRIKIADYYHQNIKNNKILLPKKIMNRKHSYHLFVIKLKNRNKLLEVLKKEGFFLGIHYKLPAHKQKIYIKNNLILKNTENISNNSISLPIYPGIELNNLKKIVKILNNF